MAITSAVIISIVTVQHIFLSTSVHPVAGFVLQDQNVIGLEHKSWMKFYGEALPSVKWNVDVTRPSADEDIDGTDEGLYNAGLFEGDIQLPTGRNAIRDDLLLWPLAAVPYTVDDSVGCPDSWRCAILMEAMEHYHQISCVRFKEWSGEPSKIHIFVNPISSACWSPVGRSGTESQELSLGLDCWYKGIVLHELLHAIGFWHEMNRPDRDDWIHVYWSNILQGYSSAFYKQDAYQVDTLGETFDYRSVMMYDEYAFSKDGVSETLRATHPEVVIGPIWKKTELSESDKRRLLRLYSCNGNQDLVGFPQAEICTFDTDVCGFLNAGDSIWRWQRVQSTGFLYTDVDNWSGSPAVLHSIGFHPKKSQESTLGCLRFSYYIENVNSKLKVRIVYLKTVTQQHFEEGKLQDLWSNNSYAKWTTAEVSVHVNQPFKLIFESDFVKNTRHGSVALDNFNFQYHSCQ
ncbi:hatching enzyme 1.2-like [Neocloeon triangulifer]|uniref:hatching enzyme 1.2-like n=1 Tax=Neocloeon triangulifer TaxID=2078957 RepID=UPI00286EFDEE|nr:hatching enzyme 1.2-like [Neocloeon triangulifer]